MLQLGMITSILLKCLVDIGLFYENNLKLKTNSFSRRLSVVVSSSNSLGKTGISKSGQH